MIWEESEKVHVRRLCFEPIAAFVSVSFFGGDLVISSCENRPIHVIDLLTQTKYLTIVVRQTNWY